MIEGLKRFLEGLRVLGFFSKHLGFLEVSAGWFKAWGLDSVRV